MIGTIAFLLLVFIIYFIIERRSQAYIERKIKRMLQEQKLSQKGKEELHKKSFYKVVCELFFLIGLILFVVGFFQRNRIWLSVAIATMFIALFLLHHMLKEYKRHGLFQLDLLKKLKPHGDEEEAIVRQVNEILAKEKKLQQQEAKIKEQIEDIVKMACHLDERYHTVTQKEMEARQKLAMVKMPPVDLKEVIRTVNELLAYLPPSVYKELTKSEEFRRYYKMVNQAGGEKPVPGSRLMTRQEEAKKEFLSPASASQAPPIPLDSLAQKQLQTKIAEEVKKAAIQLTPAKAFKPKSGRIESPESTRGIEAVNIRTELDRIYYEVVTKKRVDLRSIVSEFHIPIEQAQEWARILEEQGLIGIRYRGLGRIELVKKEAGSQADKILTKPKSNPIHLVLFGLIVAVLLGILIFMLNRLQVK